MTTINFENFSLVVTDEEKTPPGAVEIPETLLNNPEALLNAIQNSNILQDPEALAKISESTESVAMWMTLNKHKHLTVNGRLSSKHFPPEQLGWYMKYMVRKHNGNTIFLKCTLGRMGYPPNWAEIVDFGVFENHFGCTSKLINMEKTFVPLQRVTAFLCFI